MHSCQEMRILKRYQELRDEKASGFSARGKYQEAVCLRETHQADLYTQAAAEVRAQEHQVAEQLLDQIGHSPLATLLATTISTDDHLARREAVGQYNQQRIALALQVAADNGAGFCSRCRQLKPSGDIRLTYVEGTRTNSKSDCSYDYWTWTEDFQALYYMCADCQAEAGPYERVVTLESRDSSSQGVVRSFPFTAEERPDGIWAHYTEGWRRIEGGQTVWTGQRPHELTEKGDGYWVHFLDQWQLLPNGTEVYGCSAHDFTWRYGSPALDRIRQQYGLLPELDTTTNHYGECWLQLEYADGLGGNDCINLPLLELRASLPRPVPASHG